MRQLSKFFATGFCYFVVTVVSVLASPISGTAMLNGQLTHWEARSHLVTTLSPDPAGVDFPLYQAVHGTPLAGYSGVGALIVSQSGFTGICTGSMLPGGRHLVTAAHCLADEFGNPTATAISATFFPDDGGTYTDNVVSYFIHPAYTGSVFDDHDIAVVRLGSVAPETIDRYQLYTDAAVGLNFEVVGFGSRGQGDTGSTIPAGTRIRGFNTFDALGGVLLPLLGFGGANNVLMFDFDNGLAQNDAFGFWLGINDLGRGFIETSTAPGDSGGPSFINGRIAAVTSFGLTFSIPLEDGTVLSSDVLPGLNSSFGEFAGNTSIAYNADWVRGFYIPEPGTVTLIGFGLALMVLGRRCFGKRS